VSPARGGRHGFIFHLSSIAAWEVRTYLQGTSSLFSSVPPVLMKMFRAIGFMSWAQRTVA
jgi:hypothetical protein